MDSKFWRILEKNFSTSVSFYQTKRKPPNVDGRSQKPIKSIKKPVKQTHLFNKCEISSFLMFFHLIIFFFCTSNSSSVKTPLLLNLPKRSSCSSFFSFKSVAIFALLLLSGITFTILPGIINPSPDESYAILIILLYSYYLA